MNALTNQKAPLLPVLKRRMRALTYLGGATIVALLFATIAQWQRGTTSEPAFEPVRMFPALESKVDDVASIQIETKTTSFNVVRRADGQWILPDKSSYGADYNMVRKTILGLASLDLIEPRTARADWLEKLGLTLPKSGGSGTIVMIKDKKGELLASLISGVGVEGASTSGKVALYVRRPNEPQSYVARGSFVADVDQAQWLDKSFIDFPRDRIKTVSVKPFQGPSYTVTRAAPSIENFSVVERLPPGRSLRSPGEANGVGNGLIAMSFTDVVPQSKIDFSRSARATFQTFDGLALNIMVADKDNDFWIAFDAIEDTAAAVAAAGSSTLKPDIAKEVKELNAMAKGWAYKIPRFKGTLITSPLDALLNVVGGKPTPPGP